MNTLRIPKIIRSGMAFLGCSVLCLIGRTGTAWADQQTPSNNRSQEISTVYMVSSTFEGLVDMNMKPLFATSVQPMDDNSSDSRARAAALNDEHTKWVVKCLIDMDKIKVGMTRADLLKVFTTEGGPSSPNAQGYVYRGCPYIKVRVTFQLVGNAPDPYPYNPNDIILSISDPFLQFSISD